MVASLALRRTKGERQRGSHPQAPVRSVRSRDLQAVTAIDGARSVRQSDGKGGGGVDRARFLGIARDECALGKPDDARDTVCANDHVRDPAVASVPRAIGRMQGRGRVSGKIGAGALLASGVEMGTQGSAVHAGHL